MAALCLFAPTVAQAGDWDITPAIDVATTYTDNATAVTDREDRKDDLITSVAPGVRVVGRGGRLSLTLDYSHRRLFSKNGASDATSTNSLLANGNAELYDRVMFVDVNSSITRQVIDNKAPVTEVDTGSDVNRTTVQTASVQPYFLHHFGTWLETEARFTFGLTNATSEEVGNTRNYGEALKFNSGRRFSVFTFGGSLSRNKVMRHGDEPRTLETNITTDYRLAVHRTFSLIATVGWERIEDPELDEEPRGVFWTAGFSARPSSRSSLEFSAGERFNSTTYSGSASYRFNGRSTLSASYTDKIESSDQQLAGSLDFLTTDASGNLIDSRTGLPFDPSDQNLEFRTSLFRERALTVRLSAERRRNTYAASVGWIRRKTDSTGILEQVYTTTLRMSRALTHRLDGTIGGSYEYLDQGTDDQRVDQTYTGTAALSYRVFKDTTARLEYTYSQTHSTVGENNIHENVVLLNLVHRF